MEIMTTTAVYHNKETDLSAGNGSFSGENEKYDYAELLKPLKIVSLIILSLFFVLGPLGNGIVIWATGFKMKKTVNIVWYLNLAVADFLVTASLPLIITQTALDDHWPFGKFMCKMNFTMFFINMYASIYILVVISVDRCVCVVCPVWAQNHRSVRKASWVSLGVWVLALALSSPYFIFRDTQPSGHDEVTISCYNNFEPTGNYSTPEVRQLWGFTSRVMLITQFLMGFVVPFTVIVSCYSVIIYRLRNNRSLASQSRRPLKIIATVITAFVLCWAPLHILDLIIFVTEYSETLGHVVTIWIPITFGLALLNSCLNPLLYVFMGQDFKAVFHSSILKVLEKAFAEELPQTNTSANPGRTSEELPQTNTSTNPRRTSEELPHTNTSTRSTSQVACPSASDIWHRGADSKTQEKTAGGSHWFTDLCARPRPAPRPSFSPMCSIESPDVTTFGATPTALWLVGEMKG